MNKQDTIFFSVDCQKDFLNSDGALYIEDAEFIKPQLKYLTDYADKHNIKVINTADAHVKSDKEILGKIDFIKTFPAHCMIGTEGAAFIEETRPNVKETYYMSDKIKMVSFEKSILKFRNIVLLKNEFDIFKGNKYTEKVLKLLNAKNVIVYGVSLDFCVYFAIQGLLKRNYNVYAVIDAMKALPSADIIKIFSDWLNKGIHLTTTDQIKLWDKKGWL